MQVVCGNCQLSFQAPEGAAGLMCPICRSPLRPAQAAGDGAANQNLVEWSGGSLDDLVAYLSGPATAVRIEVLPATGDTAVGEVHLLAGGISETLYAGKSTDDALDKLRGVNNPRFRLETRLPNPVDGDLDQPGARFGDAGFATAGAPDALLRAVRDHLRHRSVARQRNRARRVPQGRDQRRHRGRHRRARAAGRGDAVGVGQLPPDHAQAHDARVGAESRRSSRPLRAGARARARAAQRRRPRVPRRRRPRPVCRPRRPRRARRRPLRRPQPAPAPRARARGAARRRTRRVRSSACPRSTSPG